jgi:hypothetical protein
MWGAHNELQQSTQSSSYSWFDTCPEDYDVLHNEAYSRIQQPSSTWGHSPEWDHQLHVCELGYRLPLNDVSAACMLLLLFAMEPSNEEEEGEGVLTWTKGLRGSGACGRTVNTIYTNASRGPIDQTSEPVNALRAEKLMTKAE